MRKTRSQLIFKSTPGIYEGKAIVEAPSSADVSRTFRTHKYNFLKSIGRSKSKGTGTTQCIITK